jgi:hypothetical protein
MTVTIDMPTWPSQSGGVSPTSLIAQFTKPQSGLSSARHMTPTTIGVISIGKSRMPRTIHDPRSCRLKNMASATPSTTWMTTEKNTMMALFLAAFQNCGSTSSAR